MLELIQKYTGKKNKIEKELEDMRRKGQQEYTSYQVLSMLLAQIEEIISDLEFEYINK